MGEQRVSCNDGHIGLRWTHPGECPLCACFDRIRELEAENARLREADARVTEAFAGLIERDPHQYSKRPCQTCTAATGLLGRDFGCVAKAKRGTHG